MTVAPVTNSEVVIGLFAATVVVGILAKWLKLPYPILLVLGGLLLSFQTGAVRIELPPDVIFLAFLPPLLYAAAFNTDWPNFKKQFRSISLLAVGLVLFTTVLVAATCHYLLQLPWAVGFVLGAIVSPPDAVAATAITSRVKIPKLVGTILEGESLLNDASALVALRVAIATVSTGMFVWWEAGLSFILVNAGGVAWGLFIGWGIIHVHRFLNRRELVDAKLNIAITLLTPFLAYIPAEHLHCSGVLATVTAGLWVGTRCKHIFERDTYIEAKAVWEMIEFLLNGFVFILIGFQLPKILDDLSNEAIQPEKLVFAAVAVSTVVILARILWVFPGAYIPRWIDHRFLNRPVWYPSWQNVAVVAWTGMRGVVSLAAALAIPLTLDDEAHTPFPHRNLILFLTFWVIFATLVLQGLTLPLVIRLLGVHKTVEADSAEVATESC